MSGNRIAAPEARRLATERSVGIVDCMNFLLLSFLLLSELFCAG